jgi:biotin carboxyl carrier protein
MKKYRVVVNSKIFKVEIKESYSNLQVKVNDKIFDIKVDEIIDSKLYKQDIIPSVNQQSIKDLVEIPADDYKILSPMAGTVQKIFVKPGDNVNSGDIVLMLEAMKMENEITSHITGKVKNVLITEGKNVSSKEVLIEFEN